MSNKYSETSLNFTQLTVRETSDYQYQRSLLQITVYETIRYLQALIGIIGNALTLRIIKNLKVTANGHIIMSYLAVSDILVSCVVPLGTVTTVTRWSPSSKSYWNDLCIVKEYLYTQTMGFSLSCYFVLSTDR